MIHVVEILDIANAILVVVFVLVLPGFTISYVFFPRKDQIDWVERLTLSFGLSMAIMPLAVFSLNLFFAVRINAINTFLTSIGVMVIAIIGVAEKRSKIISRRVLRR